MITTTALVYSTSTTGEVVDNTWDVEDTYGDFLANTPDPYCGVCGRPTDHVGEHDSLVGLGLAVYGDDGYVGVTEFARSLDGEAVRAAYDRAIDTACWGRKVSLIKPEGYAITFAYLAGITLPGRVR